MFIKFDDNPPYSGTIYEMFEANINAHIWYNHGLPY